LLSCACQTEAGCSAKAYQAYDLYIDQKAESACLDGGLVFVEQMGKSMRGSEGLQSPQEGPVYTISRV